MLRSLTAAVLIATAMSACASTAGTTTPPEESSMRTVASGQSTAMAQGESVRLSDGATLQFVSVPQDSRCPPKVQCIRAGDADIEFAFTPAGGTATTVTPNLPEAPTKPIGAWKLTVEQLTFGDAPKVTVRIDR
ncbi:hypothetical protein LYSHEL_03010 [Lysobacter helvus]|uniref:Lipoprotein n=3 Tax=Lysobacterales TaxID=135614 RepID=A0ABN6FTF0_9GAMM|nr:hypothetical protein LYSCAS_03010 [Lysobacter caseinilyticus]BCT94430.1 hypothetical protein LYSHEL_03010 [Lysobacter helvus]